MSKVEEPVGTSMVDPTSPLLSIQQIAEKLGSKKKLLNPAGYEAIEKEMQSMDSVEKELKDRRIAKMKMIQHRKKIIELLKEQEASDPNVQLSHKLQNVKVCLPSLLFSSSLCF